MILDNMGFVFGNTNEKYAYVITDNNCYINNMYLIIEDSLQGSIPCEVIETLALPCIDEKVLPENTCVLDAENLNFNINNPIYIAKVKSLKNLTYDIMPSSAVRRAKFNEISEFITNASPCDSMVLGVINGTESIQKDLDCTMNNIAPLWDKGAISQNGVPLLLNYRKFMEYPHIGIFGSSGSGKSFALKVFCEELMKLKIPGIVFDPHFELSFRGTMENLDNKFAIDYSQKFKEFEIGVNVGIDFEELTYMELCSLFNYIDPLTEPQKNAIEVLFTTGMSIDDLIDKINLLKEAFEYHESCRKSYKSIKEIEDSMPIEQFVLYELCKNRVSGIPTLQALGWKCISLKNTNIFVSNVDDIISTIKDKKLAIIRGNISKLQMISSYLIAKLYKYRKRYVESKSLECFFPPFFTVVDEAHNFAPADKNIPSKSILRTIGQEARKYGVFLALSTQRPTRLDTTLVAQLNTKFIFRLTKEEDINTAKVEANLTNFEAKTLTELQSGNCFISSAILNKTYSVRIRTTFSKAGASSDIFEELDLTSSADDRIEKFLKKSLPITPRSIATLIVEGNKKELNLDVPIIIKTLNKMFENKIIKNDGVGRLYKYVLNNEE